ncbi:ABC transporter permease [bacterium]|nr:ABC transporter permease [bacterium]
MKFIFSFALRNVLRNKKRGIITIIAIVVAVMISIFAQGFMEGMLKDLISNYTNYETGHIRITTKKYLERERFFPVNEYIGSPASIINKLKNIHGIVGIEERIKFGLLMGEGGNTVNCIGEGVDLLNTRIPLKKNLINGNLSNNGLYIGQGLAKKLGVGVGSTLLIATKTSEGGLNGIKLEVRGIFKFSISFFDDNFFFLDLFNARKLLKMKISTPEVLIYLKSYKSVDKILPLIKENLADNTLAAQPFYTQMGSFWNIFKIEKYIMFLFVILILILASFVIINTLMQSVFERIREIGTLKSLGMTDENIMLNFTVEGGVLGLIGGILGAIVGYLITVLMSKYGISYAGAMEGVNLPMTYVMKTSPQLSFSLITMIATFLISTIAAIFPARYAKKLTPAETLRD